MSSSVESLSIISVRFLVKNSDLYEKSIYLESLQVLPNIVKNSLLKVFTSCPGFLKNLSLNKVLEVLVNNKTTHVNLMSFCIDDTTLNILNKCSNLRKLHINCKEGNITTQGLIQAIEGKNKLYFLTINNCDAVNDHVFECIFQNCPRIKGLDVGNCINICDSALNHVKDHEITWLRLSNCKLTDEGIKALVDGKCAQSLVEFRIDHCEHVTTTGLYQITKKCPNLTSINFSNCNCVGGHEEILDFLDFKSQPKQIFWQISW